MEERHYDVSKNSFKIYNNQIQKSNENKKQQTSERTSMHLCTKNKRLKEFQAIKC